VSRRARPTQQLQSLLCLPEIIARIDALETFGEADAWSLAEEFVQREAAERVGQPNALAVAEALVNTQYLWVVWRTRKWRERHARYYCKTDVPVSDVASGSEAS
jgi:hypothetical protein